jgi:predicted O-linked N-acetylglucosamine transferase (SPINDLY family)
MASRIAGSQLRAAGLPELVTTSLAEYEALALELARAPPLREALRARLASRLGPLFDTPRYARGFEDAIDRAWTDYVNASPD